MNMSATKVKLDKPRPKPIKSLKVEEFPAPDTETSKSAIIKVPVKGSIVEEYNTASAQIKAWDTIKEECRPAVLDPGIAALFDFNCKHPTAPAKTARLTDERGNVCDVSLKDTYDQAIFEREAVVKALLVLDKKDPNKFVCETIKIDLNTSAFFDTDGNLLTAFYMEVMAAVQNVAARHNVPCPISSKKILQTVENFGTMRWCEFTREQQAMVSRMFPAQINLTPRPPQKKD